MENLEQIITEIADELDLRDQDYQDFCSTGSAYLWTRQLSDEEAYIDMYGELTQEGLSEIQELEDKIKSVNSVTSDFEYFAEDETVNRQKFIEFAMTAKLDLWVDLNEVLTTEQKIQHYGSPDVDAMEIDNFLIHTRQQYEDSEGNINDIDQVISDFFEEGGEISAWEQTHITAENYDEFKQFTDFD